MIFTGIDYSMTSPGICVYNDEHGDFSFENCNFYFFAQVKKLIGTFGKNNIHGQEYPDNYKNDIERFDNLSDIVMQFFPQSDVKVAIEGYSFGSKGSRTFQIAENGGILKYKLHKAGIHWKKVTPSAVKKFATGKGNANKDKMYEAFVNETELDLKLDMNINRAKIDSPISDIVDSYYICKWLVKET